MNGHAFRIFRRFHEAFGHHRMGMDHVGHLCVVDVPRFEEGRDSLPRIAMCLGMGEI